MDIFDPKTIKNLYRPAANSGGEDNGQVTIIGGSSLFHGAPVLALKVASRVIDMVFFSSPEPSVGRIAEEAKSKLMSFIWVPWDEIEAYIEKSDAILIGPGFMRYEKEIHKSNLKTQSDLDIEGNKTREITKKLLVQHPTKKWVIDAGSLQTINPEFIPSGAIITPNNKEFEMLFNVKCQTSNIREMANKYSCVIVSKGPETIVASAGKEVIVKGGNAGMTKGGTGDVLAGLTVALYAKNDSFLAAAAASYLAKAAADELFEEVGVNYNADDLADQIPKTLRGLIK